MNMENQEFMTVILSSMLNGVMSAIITAVLAGIIIWFIQKKYEKHSNIRSYYQDRVRKEEDELYYHIKIAKNSYYQLYKALTNKSGRQGVADDFSDNMQKALDLSTCNKTTLGKYNNYIMYIFKDYNELSNKYTMSIEGSVKNNEQEQAYMLKLLERIMGNFYAIDRIYYYNDEKE